MQISQYCDPIKMTKVFKPYYLGADTKSIFLWHADRPCHTALTCKKLAWYIIGKGVNEAKNHENSLILGLFGAYFAILLYVCVFFLGFLPVYLIPPCTRFS